MTLTILQIIPALGTGGAEQACLDIAAALVARGDKALVISSGGRRVEELEKVGGKHILAQAQTKNPLKIISHAFWLVGVILHEHVDLVHVRSRAPAWSAKIACTLTGCPFVTTFHAAYKFSSALKKRYNRVMASADHVIAISEFIARHIRESYHVPEERLSVINRGIDLSFFDPDKISEEKKEDLRSAWKIKKKDRVVLLPARLSPIKGHKFIIEVMSVLKKKGADLPLVLFIGDDQGRSTYTKELEQMIDDRGLQERVNLVGACPDMATAYSIADLVLVPSKIPEGFGRTPVEAMAMGIPVIASNLGAMVDTIVEGKTGWLLAPDATAAWAVSITAALAMDSRARQEMAKASRARVITQFDLKLMVSKTLTVYDE